MDALPAEALTLNYQQQRHVLLLKGGRVVSFGRPSSIPILSVALARHKQFSAVTRFIRLSTPPERAIPALKVTEKHSAQTHLCAVLLNLDALGRASCAGHVAGRCTGVAWVPSSRGRA